MCDCRKELETKLEENFNQNIYLEGYDMISGRSGTKFEYKEGKRNKTSYIFHEFCPFCGEKHKTKEDK